MKTIILAPALLAGLLLLQGCATPSEKKPAAMSDDTRSYFEELRSDFNTEKIRALNQAMKLTPEEADKFWPIYRQYEKDLAAVGDRKLELIREFLAHYRDGTLNDQNSKELANGWLENVQDRLDLWKKYHRRISDAVSPICGAKFLQVENQMAIFIDLNIASEMPQVGAAAQSPR